MKNEIQLGEAADGETSERSHNFRENEAIKVGFSLRNRLIILIVVSTTILSAVGYWGFSGASQLTVAGQAASVESLDAERRLDKIKATLTDLHFVVTALRLSNKNDEFIINLNKLQGLNGLFEKEAADYIAAHAYQSGGTDSPTEELKRHTHVYNATLKIFTDSLRSGNYIAADRIMSSSLSPEFLLIQKSLDRIKNQELNAKAGAINQVPALFARIRLYGVLLLFFGGIALVSLPIFLFGRAISFLGLLHEALDKLKLGEVTKERLPEPPNETGLIARGVNAVSENLERAANFANDVGRGKFDSDFSALGDKDLLGEALVDMRARLKEVSDDEAKRNWAIAGAARFGEILRKNVGLEVFADDVIVNLTKYIDAIQGGFFILQSDTETPELQLISSYAYERKKYINRTFKLGEGLVGEACRERGTIFVTEVPQNYVTITSGLGQANPRSILVVPLVANGELFGALEFAAFHKLEPHVVEFVEKMAENIASTLTNVRNNEKTVRLLQETQKITEQLRAGEEITRLNNEKLTATYEELRSVQIELDGQISAVHNAAIVSETDILGNITFANDEFCRVSKYRREELIGVNHRILKSGKQPQAIFEEMWATISAGRVWSGVVINRAKDGSFYWVKSTITPVLNESGKPIKYISVRFEITEQFLQAEKLSSLLEDARAQEEELRQNAEELESTNEEIRRVQIELSGQISALNNAAIVSEADVLGNIIMVNDEFCRVSKYERPELIGKNHRLLKSGHQPQEIFDDLWATISNGRVWQGVIKNRAKDGSYYWVASTLTPVLGPDKKPLKYIGVRFDVTSQVAQAEQIRQSLEEAQAQEEELRQNAEELESTNEEIRRVQIELSGQVTALNNAAIVSEADVLGNIILVNDEFCKVSKYDRSELIGQNHRLLKSGHQPQEIFDDLWATISSGRVWRGVIKNRAKDGSYYWVASTLTPVLGSDRKPLKYIGIRFDITNQVGQAEQIRQSLEEAQAQEEELRQNAEELESTNEEIRRVQIELSGQVNALNNAAIVSEADVLGNIILVNDEFCKVSKYERSELIGHNHRLLKSGHQPQEIFDDLWATISNGRVWQGVIKNRAKDGSYYWVASTLTPVLGSDRKPLKYIGIRFDITNQVAQAEQIRQSLEETQAQEEELRQNAEELESTNEEIRRVQLELSGQVNALNNAAIVSEADVFGNILLVNDEFCKVSKYERPELIGQNHRLLKSGHQPQEIFDDLWATISSGRVWRGVIKNRAKDGSYYWVASTLTPVLGSDRKPLKYIGIRFDITNQVGQAEQIRQSLEEAQAQEEELRQNAEELESTNEEIRRVQIELSGQVNALNNAAIVSEADVFGNILLVNDEFCKVSKYERSELIGQNHRLLKSGHQPQEIFDDLWATISGGRVWRGVIKNRAKDGTYYWVASTLTPVMGSDRKPLKYIGIRFDITNQVGQAEQIRQSLEEAQAQEEELRQNAEELESTNEEIRRVQIELSGQVNALNNAAIVSEADVLGNILLVNDEFCKVSKYERSELIGQNHRLLKSGHQPQEIFDDLWATISAGRVWRGVIKNRAKDGTYYWVASTLTPVMGSDRKPLKYIGIRFDITNQVAQAEQIRQSLEEAQAQEEELRQNAEELESTNEEIRRVQLELSGQVNALNNAAIVSEADVLGNILLVNDEFCNVSKYERSELIGQNHRLLKSGHQPQEIFNDLWATISAGRVWRGVIKNRAKDGSYYWVASTLTPLLGPDRRPIKYIGVRFDITNQVAQAEQIRQSLEEAQAQEEEMRQNAEELEAVNDEMRRVQDELVRSADEVKAVNLVMEGQLLAVNRANAVIEYDINGNILQVNDVFLGITGYTREELVGNTERILLPVTDGHVADYKLAWEKIRKEGALPTETVRVAKDGALVYFIAGYNLILGKDGRPVRILEILTDISRVKAQEEELRRGAAEMESAAMELSRLQVELKGQVGALNNAALVSEADLLGHITYVNDEFCRISKYLRTELLGKNHRLLKSGHQPQDLFVEFWSTISRGKVWRGLIKNRAKDGTYYWVSATITPVLDASNKPIKYIGVRFEVTEQINQSERMIELHDEMLRSTRNLQMQINAFKEIVGYMEINGHGVITVANRILLERTGYENYELQGAHYTALVKAADNGFDSFFAQTGKESETCKERLTLLLKDGNLRSTQAVVTSQQLGIDIRVLVFLS